MKAKLEIAGEMRPASPTLFSLRMTLPEQPAKQLAVQATEAKLEPRSYHASAFQVNAKNMLTLEMWLEIDMYAMPCTTHVQTAFGSPFVATKSWYI